MSDEEIEAMAARLEAAARVDDAKFRLEEFADEDEDLTAHLIANRAGFVRLAVLLLRAAVAKEKVHSSQLISFDHGQGEGFFRSLERREDWQEEITGKVFLVEKETIVSSWEDIGCWLIIGVGLLLTITGLVTTLKWIF